MWVLPTEFELPLWSFGGAQVLGKYSGWASVYMGYVGPEPSAPRSASIPLPPTP